MSVLSEMLLLLRSPENHTKEILDRCYRLDENFECSLQDAMRLWSLAHRADLSCLCEPYSVAILSNTTQDFFIPYLFTAGFACGLDLKIYWPGFNRIVEMATNSQSALYAASPKAIFINYLQEAKLSESYFTTLTRGERLRAADGLLQEIELVICHLVRHLPSAKLIVHTLYWYHTPALGFIDATQEDGPGDVSDHINAGLRSLAAENNNVYLLDMNRVVAQAGFVHWRNNNRWFGEGVDTVNGNSILAREYLKFIKSFTKRNRKVIVLDLDNTLWGGLAGEEGLAGIQLGSGYPGNVYKQFQYVLRLYRQRGVLIAVNSKNNPEDALAIIKNHPEMVLREDDFVAMRINWTDKATNMLEIASELNLGLNSFILIDDSPQERDLMRHAIPEVLVPAFPDQLADLPYILDRVNDLDYDSFTETDRQRTQMYKTESLRLEMKKEAATVESYLAMLETHVTVAAAGEADLGRLEQMFQRTNQFNLTNKRYVMGELQTLSRSADHAVVLASLRDKFGDLGIVATAILAFDSRATVDSFLMSCRVIGRGVETVVLAHLKELALTRGYRELYGAFVRTGKNGPSERVYLEHGFQPRGQEGSAEIFVLPNLSDAPIVVPQFIAVRS